MMQTSVLFLGLLIFSFLLSSVAVVPFINLLYRLRMTRRKGVVEVKKGDKLAEGLKLFGEMHDWKIGTPVGGGILIITIVSLLFLLVFPLASYLGLYVNTAFPMREELNIIFFTFLGFGLLGLYDDLIKLFGRPSGGPWGKVFGLSTRVKILLQWALALVVAFLMYNNLSIDIVHVPFLETVIKLGVWYVPIAAFVIVSFSNAVNFTDGLDGLAAGLLMICLFAFWVIAGQVLDTVLSVFISLWIGTLMAFLYFNVYRARIYMGDAGALSFGATLAVVGLLTGKIFALVVIGGLFVVEALSSLLQIVGLRVFQRRVFRIAPAHHLLEAIGWEEPKIVMRAWLAGIMLATLGIWLALM